MYILSTVMDITILIIASYYIEEVQIDVTTDRLWIQRWMGREGI